MARSVQDFIKNAGVAANRIEGLPAPLPQQVGPLITWAAFHLGGGFAAEAAVEQLQDPAGWESLAALLNVDSFDSLEAITFTLAATSTATALDLCSSAVFRLAGGTLRPNREFDLGGWRDAKKTAGLAPPPALGRWVGTSSSHTVGVSSKLLATRWCTVRRAGAFSSPWEVIGSRVPSTRSGRPLIRSIQPFSPSSVSVADGSTPSAQPWPRTSHDAQSDRRHAGRANHIRLLP